MAEPAALAVRGLSVTRGARVVLREISFTLTAGEILAVLGPNGAGKSTLLRATLGLVPSQGEVTLAGTPLAALSHEQRSRLVTFVPQASELHAALPVRDVVALGRYAHYGRARREDDEAAVAAALRDVDLVELADRAFCDLSSGEKKRVLLARALSTEAPALLLDEPTSSLDIEHALRFFALIGQAARAGRAIIIVLHQLEHALELADRALLLKGGRMLAHGPTRDVVTPAHVRDLYGVELIPGGAPGFRLPEEGS